LSHPRPSVNAQIQIREASPGDVEQIYAWIVELATYERAPEQVTGTPELLAEALFGSRRCAEAVIAELAGKGVGFALFHGNFSTWECRPGIWLEDLYVPPENRRHGVGAALLRHVAEITIERGGTRLEWVVLDWNASAIGLYQRVAAKLLDDWRVYRLDGEALAQVAEGVKPAR
jgi:GNAT superfamily N-acetyltransferase